jgi:hypothetical protein
MNERFQQNEINCSSIQNSSLHIVQKKLFHRLLSLEKYNVCHESSLNFSLSFANTFRTDHFIFTIIRRHKTFERKQRHINVSKSYGITSNFTHGDDSSNFQRFGRNNNILLDAKCVSITTIECYASSVLNLSLVSVCPTRR